MNFEIIVETMCKPFLSDQQQWFVHQKSVDNYELSHQIKAIIPFMNKWGKGILCG
jgi:hypothetical protein